MSYGVKSYGDDGYLNLHSDYSSMVYLGEMVESVAPAQFVYTGDYSQTITNSKRRNNYDLGYVVQLKYNTDVSHIVPFYMPASGDQEVAIMDIVKESGVWKVNLCYSGTLAMTPRVFIFVPMKELSSVSQNDYGLSVYDEDGDLVFTDKQRPLRIDDVIQIDHPDSIRTGSKGSCGNDPSCDVNYTPDQSATFTGTVTNTNSKMYHIVPSAYGGLAYQNDGTYRRKCGFLDLGRRKYAWGYSSWSSFRGSLKHPRSGATHVASYVGDFSGKAYQLVSGSCGYGGFLGALLGVLGVVLAPITGGASLGLLAVGAIGGFVIGENVFAPSTPSLRSYTQDETFETSKPSNMIMTDANYYGIDPSFGSGGSSIPDGLVEQFDNTNRLDVVALSEGDGTYYWSINEYEDAGEFQLGDHVISGYWDGVQVFINYGESNTDFAALNTADVGPNDTSVTATDGYTYYKGNYRDTFEFTGILYITEDHYGIARD